MPPMIRKISQNARLKGLFRKTGVIGGIGVTPTRAP
jgi:hypothetical protein